MADEPKQFILYAPDGAEYKTTVPVEAVRLRAAGYSDTKPAAKAEDKPADNAGDKAEPGKPSRPKPGDTPA